MAFARRGANCRLVVVSERERRAAGYRIARDRAGKTGSAAARVSIAGSRVPRERRRPGPRDQSRASPIAEPSPHGPSSNGRSGERLAQVASGARSPESRNSMTHHRGSAPIAVDLAVRTQKEEEMRHPTHIWTDPAFAEESLRRLRDEYKRQI